MKKQKFFARFNKGIIAVYGYIFTDDNRLFIQSKSMNKDFNYFALVDIKTGLMVCNAGTKKELIQKYELIKSLYEAIGDTDKRYINAINIFNELLKGVIV